VAARRAKAAGPGGLYAVVGEDSYLAEEALERVLEETVGPDRGQAVQVIRGDEAAWTRVVEAAATRSLFAERKAVVVRNAEALKGDEEAALRYVEDPNPNVALVLVAARPDRRRTLWKRLLEAAEVRPAEPLKGRALRGYVVELVRRRGLTLTEEGLEELLERVGQDLRRLAGEVDKLEAFARGRGALGAEDVDAVLGRGLARPLYRLGDALAARRAGEALELMEELLEEGEAPLRILGTLHRALRQVRGARALGASRATREQVASRLQVMPFKVPSLLESARGWSEQDLRRAAAALDRADRRIKTSGDPRVSLTSAVVEACGATSPPRPGR
jgi:DNA polymerase-3 subunit delta